jgi:predicted nucleic-acid-binding protein
MKVGLDTNVLVRHLVQDDPRQADLARELIEENCSFTDPAFLSLIVLCETVWVLGRAYGYSRELIHMAMRQILLTDCFEVEDHALAWEALHSYQSGKADYADCLIACLNRNHGCSVTFTFDKAAARLRGVSLLTKNKL